MLDLYAWPTPNGLKVSVMLEETGLPYRVIPVDIGAGEQFTPAFLKISPNNKIPAIVDHDAPGKSLSIFESGAILMYLAEKTGRLWPTEIHDRYEVAKWLMWQMSGLGPMLGQSAHFRRSAPTQIPYAIERYGNEAKRLLGVLDGQLSDRECVAQHYSIADIAIYPWSLSFAAQGMSIDDFPHVKRWQAMMAARPAVQKGMQMLAAKRQPLGPVDAKTREILFGNQQYARK